MDNTILAQSAKNSNLKPRVIMMGLGLSTTTGIAKVVNNWIAAGYDRMVDLVYISTNDNQIPGQFARKLKECLLAYIKLIKYAFSGADILHLHLAMYGSFWRKQFPLFLARLMKIKTIIHLHGSEFKEFYENGSWFRKLMIRNMFEKADMVFVLSREWHKWVKSITQKPGKIEIVYNTALKQKLSSKKCHEKVTITKLGRLGRRKGTYNLLDAFKRLASRYPKTRLVLAGDGEIKKVKKLVSEYNLNDRVEVPGWLSWDQVNIILAVTDIYALPSFNEGLPNSILEAISWAIPVVSTPVGGICEAVINEKTGFLINPGDVNMLENRLERLIVDNDMRIRMGKAGHRLFKDKFDIEGILKQIVDIQCKLI